MFPVSPRIRCSILATFGLGLSVAMVSLSHVAAAPTRPANAPVDAAFFTREVQPILSKRCLGCHGVDNRLGNLDLRSRTAALKGGTHGPALVPGQAEQSLLYHLVSGRRTPLMPPGGKLPPREIAILKRWLDGGAPWSSSVTTAQKQVWWAWKPPTQPRVPEVPNSGSWIRNPIDAFVLARLRQEGLSPNPPASRRVLIRRVYLDLIGLPPSPEAVEAFVKDASPDAWEKVVDRLLASPRYGERWARHWLDLVRYADSSGFEGDKDRPNAWRYRDYVIRSFNDDKPYDQFIREQLAGDELDPDDHAALIATGYLACGQEDFAMVKTPQRRADEIDDLVATTGGTFLGLTLGCARCHDHKYDPVKQTDYFRLYAIFAPTVRKDVPVPTPEERQAVEQHNARIEQELSPLRQQHEALRMQGLKAAQGAGQAQPNEEQIRAALPESERKRLDELQKAIQAGEAKRQQLPQAMIVTDAGPKFDPVPLHIRGDVLQPGPIVEPGFIASLPDGERTVGPEVATLKTTGRRLALAEWISSPQNPLTARVWMNRVWRQHFGVGIVATPSNFGINGDLPSHPELLDWLAVQFQASGWRLKPMHRLMLLSSTYQQSSTVRPEAMRSDPQNRYLWRMPVRRLEAEAIRDSILSITSALNPEMYGPPVYPPVDPSLRADTFQGVNWPEGEDSPKTWRRSIYVKVKRSLLLPELEVFDCPEISAAVPQRNATVTPLQALTMLNSPLILRQAEVFAARLQREAGNNPQAQVRRAYALAFGRTPSAREQELSVKFLKEHSLTSFCHSVLNLSELIYVP